ncbi:MAG: hypothetical protein HQL11_02830 [Candidatus Omnitrophica bacterium]|nr:hypothetical protein [Candidatus Omnitrophota bacterium]
MPLHAKRTGDLKDPERSIPRGTLAAVGVSYVIYMVIPIVLKWGGVSEQQLLTEPLIMRDVARWGGIILVGLWGASLSSAVGSLLGAPQDAAGPGPRLRSHGWQFL